MNKKPKKKLNSYTEEKNNQPPVKVEEAKIIGETELPETKIMVPVKDFAMPIANPEQLQKGMELYQKCLNALIKAKDVVMVEGRPHGKKIAVNKINRVFGVSTEVLRSFLEERIAHKDYWSKGFRKSILVHKGEKYTIAKAWVKAVLPNGQFCTRGGAVSETERRFAHFPHDLMATAETRAMKNAAENLLGIEFEMVEDEQSPNSGPETPQNEPQSENIGGFEEVKGSILTNVQKREMNVEPENREFFHPLASEKQKKLIETIVEKLGWKLTIEINKITKDQAQKIIDKGLAAAKRKEINLFEDEVKDNE